MTSEAEALAEKRREFAKAFYAEVATDEDRAEISASIKSGKRLTGIWYLRKTYGFSLVEANAISLGYLDWGASCGS